jgi:hypothetical protein
MLLSQRSPTISGRRGQQAAKVSRNRAIAGLLKELEVALELDAFIAESGADPFHRHAPVLGSVG